MYMYICYMSTAQQVGAVLTCVCLACFWKRLLIHAAPPQQMEAAAVAASEPASIDGDQVPAEPAAPDSAAAAAAAAATAAAALGQLAAALTTQFQEQAEAAGLISPPPESAVAVAADGSTSQGAGAAITPGGVQSPALPLGDVSAVAGSVDMVAAAAKALAGLSSRVAAPKPVSITAPAAASGGMSSGGPSDESPSGTDAGHVMQPGNDSPKQPVSPGSIP